jgi:hypothetical protein
MLNRLHKLDLKYKLYMAVKCSRKKVEVKKLGEELEL